MSDTIVALSSPVSQFDSESWRTPISARAIIRLSGPQAFSLAEKFFLCRQTGEGGCFPRPVARGRLAGEVKWRSHALPACAYLFPAPHSYTRENIAELHVPALPWVVSTLMEELLAAGARLAQAGEFTRRAFENGRMSLSQAEAVAALINSRTADEARAQAARLQRHAHSQKNELRAGLSDLLALVEFGLDFSPEDAEALPAGEILRRLEQLKAFAQELSGEHGAEDADASCLNSGLPRIVLTGSVNAGKSSLFNALLGREAALVSSLPHTTRDVVEAPVRFSTPSGPLAALLLDTAGSEAVAAASSAPPGPFHDELRCLRRAAWQEAINTLRSADILLLLADAAAPLCKGQDEILKEALAGASPAAIAVVWTKTDLKQAVSAEAQRDFVAGVRSCQRSRPQPDYTADAVFSVSSVTGAGLSELRAFLAAQVAELHARTGRASLGASAAARSGLTQAAAALARASAGFSAGGGEDLVAVELREALQACASAEGVLLRHDAVTEAALDRIFSRFCVGK